MLPYDNKTKLIIIIIGLILITGVIGFIFKLYNHYIQSKIDEIREDNLYQINEREGFKEGMNVSLFGASFNIPSLNSIGNMILNPVEQWFQELPNDLLQAISPVPQRVPILFSWFGNMFMSVFGYFGCAVGKIETLPMCTKWYFFDMIGQILYCPFKFLFWFTGTTAIETMIWDTIYSIDTIVYTMSGVHFAHFPDSVVNTCYNCNVSPVPPWPF